MEKLWDELEADTKQYLRQWYNGEAWSSYVDAIIGITAQATPDDTYPIQGLSPPPSDLDQGRIFTILKWKVYWADDNLVQHEVSHLFYAPDHPEYQDEPCCAMAHHTHFVYYTWEDALWWVLNDVPCGYTSHDWCGDCYGVIDQKKSRYNYPPWYPLWDVNQDGECNIKDINLVARALGTDDTYPWGTGWDEYNPDADINGDRQIDCGDLTIVGKHYGEEY